ncbi:hypothetical protein M0R45_036858 [Rubus argutus]
MMQTSPVLYGNVEMLQHAEEVYTPKNFKLFQQQYTSIGDYVANKVSKSDMKYEYKVSYRDIAREHLVKFDALVQTITCSCMKFSFVGILCRHALKVLDKKNVRRIPSSYILNRWSKEAKARSIINYQAAKTSANPKESIGKRYSHLCRNYREIASVAAEHEELTKYAHEHSIELLKNLEEKKKKLLKENTCGKENTSEGHDDVLGEMSKACGVKRKAVVGRPRGSGGYGRFKGILEGKKNIVRAKSYASTSPIREAQAKRQISFQKIEDEVPTLPPSAQVDSSTQLSACDPEMPFQDKLSFTQLLDTVITPDDFS